MGAGKRVTPPGPVHSRAPAPKMAAFAPQVGIRAVLGRTRGAEVDRNPPPRCPPLPILENAAFRIRKTIGKMLNARGYMGWVSRALPISSTDAFVEEHGARSAARQRLAEVFPRRDDVARPASSFPDEEKVEVEDPSRRTASA